MTIGLFATTYTAIGTTTGYNNDDRVFAIGNGTASGARSNAITVYKGGVGAAKIHINPGTSTTVPSENMYVSGTANITGTTTLSGYGLGNKEAANLSKTQSAYITGFATDGTVVEMEDLHVATTGLVTMDEYDNSAPFTSLTVGEDATDLFLTTTSTTGKVIGKAMRQITNVKDADLTITDNMLDLSMDIHVWAYCSNAASDSVVIDLPTPGTDYLGQMVSIYGDGRNATPNRDVYVRCVGAKLWHGNASPTGETYYQVTSLALARNSKTAEFTCVQNPDDNLYYWQLKQHP